jgi:hypothetical protein
MKTRIAVAAGVAALAVGGIVGAPSANAATPSCDRAPWADRVEGVPTNFTAGARGGDYLWHDATGFHLRVTHKNDNRVVYTGEITSPVPMRMEPVKLEKGDVARLSADHRTLYFAFVDYGHIDGVNFHTDCAATITVSHLNAGNVRLPTSRVYLGKYEVHPAAVPFTLHRQQPTP